MSKEMRERVKEARMYQRKAIRALLPENVAVHMEAIEEEVKSMVMECAMNIIKNNMGDGNEECKSGDEEVKKESRTQKVTIE